MFVVAMGQGQVLFGAIAMLFYSSECLDFF